MVVDPGDGLVGIMCLDESAATWRHGGFGFIVGHGEASLVSLWDPDFGDIHPVYLRPGQRIGINCGSEVLTLDSNIQGLVDGEVIATLSNDHSTGFDRVALLFLSAHEGDFVRYDNVIARVP